MSLFLTAKDAAIESLSKTSPNLSPFALIGERAYHAASKLVALKGLDASEAIQLAIGTVSAIPIVGQVFALVGPFIAASQAYELPSSEEYCQKLAELYPVAPPSGSLLGGCRECPADIFAPLYPTNWQLTDGLEAYEGQHRPWLQVDNAKPGKCCSLLGYAYILATERALRPWPLEQALSVGYPGLAVSPPTPAGLSTAIQRVRIAIGRSYSVAGKPVAGSDGGAALWLIWLDLALQLEETGALTLSVFDRRVYPRPNQWTFPDDQVCDYSAPLQDLLGSWRNTVKPNYDTGMAALGEAQAELWKLTRPKLKFSFHFPNKAKKR